MSNSRETPSGQAVPFILLSALAGVAGLFVHDQQAPGNSSNLAIKLAGTLGYAVGANMAIAFGLWLIGAVVYLTMSQSYYWTPAKGGILFGIGILTSFTLIVVALALAVFGPGHDDARIVAAASAKFRRDLLDNTRVFSEEQEDIGAFAVFTPTGLSHGFDFQNAAGRIQRARSLQAESNRTFEKSERDFRQSIEASPMSQAGKSRFLASFDQGLAGERASRARQLSEYGEALDDVQSNVDLLRNHRDAWSVQKDKMIFRDRSVMQAFNRNIMAVNNAFAEDRAMVARGGPQ